jgi:predicted acetyltransferase
VPTPATDFVVYEFFVAHAWRGAGVAADAARLGFAQHRGTWEVSTWPTAARAIAFWRKTLRDCARGELKETEEEHRWGRRVVFRFDNRIE